MLAERVEQLKTEYVGQYVAIDTDRPELARFLGMVGQVRTMNLNGRALVEFDADNNRGRYDIGLDYLKVVDKPAPAAPKAKAPAKKKTAKPASNVPDEKSALASSADSAEGKPDAKLSPLEVARMKKQEADAAGKPDVENSPTDPPGEKTS